MIRPYLFIWYPNFYANALIQQSLIEGAEIQVIKKILCQQFNHALELATIEFEKDGYSDEFQKGAKNMGQR